MKNYTTQFCIVLHTLIASCVAKSSAIKVVTMKAFKSQGNIMCIVKVFKGPYKLFIEFIVQCCLISSRVLGSFSIKILNV